MTICAVQGCGNGEYKLNKWKTNTCDVHPGVKKGTGSCICPPPFVLYPFPTERKDPNARRQWIQLLNRKDVETGKSWVPKRYSRVCSAHFPDGSPTETHPYPTQNLGHISQERGVKPRKRPKEHHVVLVKKTEPGQPKGQPAYETLDTDPDWVPSLHLGHPEPIHQIKPEKSTDIVTQRPKLEIATTSKSKKTSFFVQHECCVVNCDGRSHNDRGQRIRNGLAFYPFPVWRKNDGVFISNLSKRRREAWVTAVGRDDITFDNVPEDAQVCSRHFVSGKPAHDMMEKDADWMPSLHLNYKKTPIKTPAPIKEKPLKKKLNKKVMSKANAAKPRSVPWKDLKSRLQGLMMDKEQPTELPPVVDENDENVQSFEDFFRNALTASLDACLDSGSQSLAEPRPSLDTSWFPGPQKPPLSMPMSLSRKRTSSLSSSTVSEVPCANCVRLQERIAQLEERLATPQYIQDPNTFTQWTQPLHPAESRWGQERPGLEKKSFPPKGRFDTEMLARHWFLRYSPKTNMMWCHVCRFYAPENNRRGGFVAGTRTFQNFTIVQHSKTSFHQECVRRFQARKGRGRK